MSQLKNGAILSYVNIALTNTIGLLLTPFIIRSLGDSEYGLYMLIGSVIAYLSVLDLGLNNAIIRYVSKYRAENDKKGEENFLATTMIIYSCISLVVAAIGIFLYYRLETIFAGSLTAGQADDAKKMFLILVFNLTITLPGGSFTAICNAYQRFIFPRALQIVKYLSRAALIVSFLFYFPYATTLVWIDTILNLVIVAISAFYVFRHLKVRFRFNQWDKKLVSSIFSYSIWIFLAAIVMKLQWNAGQVVLGISTDTIAVAIFGVGVMLGGYYGAFAGAINTLLLPKATRMSVHENDEKAYNSAIQKVGRINGFILFLILAGFFVYGKDFIILWVGKTYLPAWQIALLIMIAMTLPLTQAFGNSILEAKKKNRFRSLVGIVTVGLAVVVSIFLVPKYNFNGVIYPFFFALLFNSFAMSWYFNKIFGYNFIAFLKSAFLKPFLIIAPMAFAFIVLKSYWQINNWLGLGIQIGVFALCYFILIYAVVMSSEERNLVWKKRV